MKRSLKRPVCLLLSVMMIIGIFTVVPVTTAGAIADTSDPWIFKVNDGATYDLDGKWVRFDGEDFQLEGNDKELTLTNRTTYIYQLKYGNVQIADSRSTLAGAIHIGDTVYVTGLGTEDHPYIFTPNVVFYDSGKTFGKGATIAIGYENLGNTASNNNGVAFPGDGFKETSRMQVGINNYVRFMQHDEQDYQPNQVSTVAGYIGVRTFNSGVDYGTYNGSSNFSNDTNHWTFQSGNDTLYYLGREAYGENSLYTFSESPDIKTDFSGTNKVVCTVTWENDDGTVYNTMQYALGETAVEPSGMSPTKTAGANFIYTFRGWEPSTYEPLDDDTSYVAQFDVTVTGELTYSVNSWIFSTDDGRVYDDIGNNYFKYNDIVSQFPDSDGSFSVENDQISICGLVVADIDTSKAYKTFANTVYVTTQDGTYTNAGTAANPFIFIPNYVYGTTGKTNVKDGVSVAINEAHLTSADKNNVANPGDGFKAMSRIRVYNSTEQSDKTLYKVQFLEQNGLYRPSRYMLGVGDSTYGYRYSKSKGKPFSFVSDDQILYYFEESSAGIYQFSESAPPLRQSFNPANSNIYKVIWKNYDGSELDTGYYYQGDTPTYKGAVPTKPGDSEYDYSFSGWTPALGEVTDDTEYTATYTATPAEGLFVGHSLTLEGDIGLNFYLNVTADEVTDGSGTEIDFSWNVNGHSQPKTSTATLSTDNYIDKDGHRYYKATCWVAAAEMAYNIHATATINGALQAETDDYSVKEYGVDIINAPAGTYEKQDKLTALATAMLDYGAKAQVVFDRQDVALANSELTGYTMTEITKDNITSRKSDMSSGTSAFGLEYYGSSVIYLTQTTLRHYYKVTDSSKLDSVKAAAAASGFEFGEKNGVVYFDKKNIPAADLDTVYTISLGSGGDYGYSALDYSRSVLEKSSNADEKKLAMATYWYNYAANDYFNS